MLLFSRTTIITGLLVMLLPWSTATVRAQQAISPSIGIAPALVRRDVVPGQSQTIKITLTNYGADPLPLSAQINSITGIGDDGAPEFTSVIGPRSASNWLTISKPDVIISGHNSEDIEVKISPPASAAPGGYNAAVLFQAKLPSYYFDLDANARVLPALSASLLLTVDTDTPPTVSDLKITRIDTPSVVLSSPIPVVTELTNPTNFYIFTDSTLSLNPTFGGVQTVTNLKNSVIFPDSSRKFVTAYTGSLLPGVYKATLSLRQDQKVLVASAKFVAIPWPFLLLLIIAVFSFFFFLGRRRLRKAYRALVGHPAHPPRPLIR